jgi:hypothetical protein
MSNEIHTEDTVENIMDDIFEDDVVELNPSQEPSGSRGTSKKVITKRKRTSIVWNFFDPIHVEGDDMVRAKCKSCGKTYKAPGEYGTGNMTRHMNKCARKDTPDVGQMLLSASQGGMSVVSSKFDPKKFRELIVASIIKHDLPFRYVEYEGVRESMQYLRPGVQLISRNTVKADLCKMYANEKQKLKAMLSRCNGRISLTSDLWSSLTTDGYICLTAHFIDTNWILQKMVLNFSFMAPPHNGSSLCKKVLNMIQEWGIDTKIFSITLDNASANDNFVLLLKDQLNLKKALVSSGEFFHLRCCAHILNLIVQDGLKEIDGALQKARDCVKYVKGSQVRKQKFMHAVNQMSIDGKMGLKQDVATRWNSTYLMLVSVIHYRLAFSYLDMTEPNFDHCPTPLEWEKMESICGFLGSFYNATCEFSGTKYPTANLYFSAVSSIYMSLIEENESEDEYKRSMAAKMLSKFEKYWSSFSSVLAIAVILDPRYKTPFVNFCYTKIYGVDNSNQFKDVWGKLFSLFAEYSGSTTSSSSTITAPKPVDRKALAKPNRMRMVKLYVYLVIYVILLLYNIYTLNLPINYIYILRFFI